MKSFWLRFLSAVGGLAILLSVLLYSPDTGFVWLCLGFVLIGAREIIGLLFQKEDSWRVKALFYICVIGIFATTVFSPQFSSLSFALLTLFFCSFSLLMKSRFASLDSLLEFQAKSVLGFFYLGLLPALGCRLLFLPNGNIWFLGMLAIVFAGDTAAYLGGSTFGKNKIMPSVSPKKTIEGSICGLLGSMIAGFGMSFFLPEKSSLALVGLALVVGVFAQMGDLFESLLKRVANIKDSGAIMPGHGGVLDRLDGVLFASPIMLLGTSLLERLL